VGAITFVPDMTKRGWKKRDQQKVRQREGTGKEIKANKREREYPMKLRSQLVEANINVIV